MRRVTAARCRGAALRQVAAGDEDHVATRIVGGDRIIRRADDELRHETEIFCDDQRDLAELSGRTQHREVVVPSGITRDHVLVPQTAPPVDDVSCKSGTVGSVRDEQPD